MQTGANVEERREPRMSVTADLRSEITEFDHAGLGEFQWEILLTSLATQECKWHGNQSIFRIFFVKLIVIVSGGLQENLAVKWNF